MSNRVTQSMLNQNFLFNLNRSNKAMEKYQDQFSSGKKISKPSDDPVTAVRGMFYRSTLSEINQFKKNADDGLSWMTATDDALDEVTSVIHRVRELTVEGLNGTNDDSSLEAIASEIDQLKEHLGEIANTQMAGKYLFAGTDTKNAPYRLDPNDQEKKFINQNSEAIQVQVGQTNNVQINVNGKNIFASEEIGSIFDVLTNITKDLRDPSQSQDDHLSKLDAQLDNILKERAELGARMNRMELSQTRIDDLEVSATSLLSETEDADLSKVIIDLKSQENVQRAALSAGARIIQSSLVDFLS
ncbi:flagellar hook-associated protein FlgL [Bacillus rubiinfantis]|uniref:flagellar hook-associated protein FlgL n=1 Tax=Bacillus rubiinfantis TaxID=1499680 RepID=UPI0005A62A1A|nr:flagellar hook-associated protein FlgL [Bacillus rubiinfantis]